MRISTTQLEVLDSTLAPGTPLAYSVVGGSPMTSHTGVVNVGQATDLHLDDGVYEVTLTHPKHGRLYRTLHVGAETETVHFREMERRSDDRPMRMARSGGPVRRPALEGLESAAGPRPPVRVTCFRGAPGNWHADPWPGPLELAEGANVALPVEREYDRTLVVVDGDVRTAVRLPPDSVRIEASRSRSGEIVVRPRLDNHRAESLLDYVDNGYVLEAVEVRGSAHALELIDRERECPAAAAIGAYYLLRTGEAKDCLPWYEQLVQNFPQMPDFAVALGWALIQSHHLGPARAVLLSVPGRGVPVYREGVVRLRDGIDVLRSEIETDSGPVSSELRSVLEWLTEILRNLRQDCPVTTWRCGDTPDPRARPRRGPRS